MKTKLLIYRVTLCALILCLMAFIFWHSSKPGSDSYDESGEIVGDVLDVVAPEINEDMSSDGWQRRDTIHLWFRKGVHLCIFAALSFCATLLLSSYDIKRWAVAIFSIAFTILYAVSDEVHQHFVPGRKGALFDVGVDSLGAVVGWACAILAIWLFWNVQRRKQKTK